MCGATGVALCWKPGGGVGYKLAACAFGELCGWAKGDREEGGDWGEFEEGWWGWGWVGGEEHCGWDEMVEVWVLCRCVM